MAEGFKITKRFGDEMRRSIAVTKAQGGPSSKGRSERGSNRQYIEIDSKIGGFDIEFTGHSVIYDLATEGWVATTPQLDWDGVDARLVVEGGADVGDIVLAYPIRALAGEQLWIGVVGGKASLIGSFIINLTGGSGQSYTGTVVGFPELGTVAVSAPSVNSGLTLPFSVNYTSTSQTTLGEVVTYIIQPLVFL